MASSPLVSLYLNLQLAEAFPFARAQSFGDAWTLPWIAVLIEHDCRKYSA